MAAVWGDFFFGWPTRGNATVFPSLFWGFDMLGWGHLDGRLVWPFLGGTLERACPVPNTLTPSFDALGSIRIPTKVLLGNLLLAMTGYLDDGYLIQPSCGARTTNNY